MSPAVVPSRPALDENWYRDDPLLADLLKGELPESILEEAHARLDALGALAPQKLDALARLADRHRPVLHRRSAEGERIDEVEFHPAYRELQRAAREHGVFTLAWHPFGKEARAPRVLGFALGYLYAQAECGYYCPACMTDGAAFVLSRHAGAKLRDHWVPKLIAPSAAGAAEGAMYMTEKGGGSDVGGGTETRAERHGDAWRLTGEKWFASNCVADVALALARMPNGGEGTAGLGLFVVPRRLPGGASNPGLRIERLKDKLGVTSMATGEIVLDGAHADLVCGAGDGFKAMAEMVNLSRLYNAVASVGLARRALREGQRAGLQRSAFGHRLLEHPLYLRKLTEMTLDVEGALAFTMDTAKTFDAFAEGDARARKLVRVLTPCAKAMTGRLAVSAASDACELLGGVGYIEEYVTPRLLRDAQVLPIWEGTTNIQALEFLRAALRDQAMGVFVPHVEGNLARAPASDMGKAARDAVRGSLKMLADDVERLSSARRAQAEVAALRLMATAYHAHATALLLRVASVSRDPKRALRVAGLYAARHLSDGRDLAERALDAAVAEGRVEIAYPALSS